MGEKLVKLTRHVIIAINSQAYQHYFGTRPLVKTSRRQHARARAKPIATTANPHYGTTVLAMASGDNPRRRFQVRQLSKAVRSCTRRYRAAILGLIAFSALLIWFSTSAQTKALRPASIDNAIRGRNPFAKPEEPADVPKDEKEEENNAPPPQQPPNDNVVPDAMKREEPPNSGPKDNAEEEKDDAKPDAKPDADTTTNTNTASTNLVPLVDDPEREKWRASKMSVVILFHNEYDSLRTALKSWIENGLVAEIDEILFFVNGGKSEQEFASQLSELLGEIPESKRRIVVSTENLKLGLAITKMVELASHEFVMLLEKDWKLIEDSKTTASRLLDSKVIVGSGVAHLIRHRHRHNPGVPLHALIMHQGREQSIMRGQRNLMCFVHHWQKDPTKEYPGEGLMWRCGGHKNHMEEVDVFCSKGEYCQWNNNPCVFKKDWFMTEIGERFRTEYEKERSAHGDTSPFLDFEYYTNWRPYAWADKDFTVAVGEGLFSHAESEHKHFNTFWYAHYRLETDFEELRNEYLRNETRLKRMGGVHYDTSGPPPPPMLDRYPIEFARKFHWKEIFQHDLKKQREEIATIYDEYVKNFRVSEADWKTSGVGSVNYGKTVPWRKYTTDLHFTVEKGELMVPPLQPFEMNITLVTTLLDIGRSNLDHDEYKFRREFKEYLDKMEVWLQHDYPKVVYTTEQIAKEIMKTASDKVRASTKFVFTTREELATRWIGSDNYRRVQDIRTSKQWLGQASWLENSPQAKLADYNPLVMAKMFMLRDTARTNPWNTTHFVFLDAKHNCMVPDYMNPKHDHILRAHMFGKFLMTYFDYTPSTEIHGFAYQNFNDYLNIRDRTQRQMVKVGRGGIFGGSAYSVEYITAMYDVVLTATLREGLMGTEENIFSILMAQVPQYIDTFSNNWACYKRVEKDHKCPDTKGDGYNCEIFKWMQFNV